MSLWMKIKCNKKLNLKLNPNKSNLVQTKWSERAKRAAHSVLREVEKMGYKKISARTRIG